LQQAQLPVFVWEIDGTIKQWNRGAEALLGLTARNAIGKKRETLLKTASPGTTAKKIKDALLKEGRWCGTLTHTGAKGSKVTVESLLEVVTVEGEHWVLETAVAVETPKRKKA
jgi:PAS domain S-box-containing protein